MLSESFTHFGPPLAPKHFVTGPKSKHSPEIPSSRWTFCSTSFQIIWYLPINQSISIEMVTTSNFVLNYIRFYSISDQKCKKRLFVTLVLPPSSVRNARATPPFFGFSAVSGHSYGCFHNSLAILVRSKPWGKCLPLTLTIGGPKKWPKVPKKKSFVTLMLPSIPRSMSQTLVTIGSVKVKIWPYLTLPFKVLGAYYGNIFGIYLACLGHLHLDTWDMLGIILSKYLGSWDILRTYL